MCGLRTCWVKVCIKQVIIMSITIYYSFDVDIDKEESQEIIAWVTEVRHLGCEWRAVFWSGDMFSLTWDDYFMNSMWLRVTFPYC